jgi:uncharacterized protein YbjT (DUF2867 family)
MRIAITTPTGHIGYKLTHYLLSAGAKVVLLARDGAKVRTFEQMGAVVRQGSQDDPKFVTEATADASALFWLTPPNMVSPDLREFQRACGYAAARAVRVNKIPHVVNLSSFGAHAEYGAGPVSGLHDVEQLLDAEAPNLVHLRAGFFFENFLWQLNNIQEASSILLPMDGARRIPMIATKDIAAVACGLLLDESWEGLHIRGLQGPADLNLHEAAEQISYAVGRTVRYVSVAEDQARKLMSGIGMSGNVIELMLEMYRGLSSGWMTPQEPRTLETTTPSTLQEFAREHIAPLLRKEVCV